MHTGISDKSLRAPPWSISGGQQRGHTERNKGQNSKDATMVERAAMEDGKGGIWADALAPEFHVNTG
jgi:hypothetical protein